MKMKPIRQSFDCLRYTFPELPPNKTTMTHKTKTKTQNFGGFQWNPLQKAAKWDCIKKKKITRKFKGFERGVKQLPSLWRRSYSGWGRSSRELGWERARERGTVTHGELRDGESRAWLSETVSVEWFQKTKPENKRQNLRNSSLEPFKNI